MRSAVLLTVPIAFCCLSPNVVVAGSGPIEPVRARTREFRFDYGATLKDLKAGARVRVWLPVPPSTDHQKVTEHGRDLPVTGRTSKEPTYGNKVTYFECPAPANGQIRFNVAYDIQRREVRGLSKDGQRVRLTTAQRKQFLSANSRVPLEGPQTELLTGIDTASSSIALARELYGRVDEHVRYDKTRPGYGNGDVHWVCDSRTGNCTDFHSLFISLARAKGLPARFEIGFPLPPKRGTGTVAGYHCWALFHTDDHGWVPVDISEADKHPEMKEYYFGNLTADRVTFTTGRDIQLVPRQDGKPLNYFVYPYIEVDGKPLPKKHIELSFRYRDKPAPKPAAKGQSERGGR